MIFFNEQQDWRIVYHLYENFPYLKVGTYVDYYTQQTVPFFGFFDFLVCNTQRHYSVFDRHRQAFYVPWGTDVDDFKPRTHPDRPLTFFHSAGASPFRKGTDLVLKAFDLLGEDSTRLVVHSQEDLGKYFNGDILRLLARPNVELVVKTVTKPGLYHLGDIYVYPSRLDGLGLTLAEALSCGLPAITLDASPMNEFVADEVNGKLVRVGKYISRSDGYYWPESICDPRDLAESMRFFVMNKAKIDNYKANARQGALTELNWRTREVRVDEIFETTDITRYGAVSQSLVGSLLAYCRKQYTPLTYSLARGVFRVVPESARQYLYLRFSRNTKVAS